MATTFLIFSCITLCAKDTATEINKKSTGTVFSMDTLIINRGINFCGIAIHKNTDQSTFEIIDTNHK